MEPRNVIRQGLGELPARGGGDEPEWKHTVPIVGPHDGGEIMIGVEFHDMPTDGYVAFSVPGPDPQNSINYPKSPISQPNGSVVESVNWPPDYSSMMTIEWWKGATTPQKGAGIEPIVFLPAL